MWAGVLVFLIRATINQHWSTIFWRMVGLSNCWNFRDVANGEVVGVSLLLEDVLHQGRAKQDKHLAVNPLVDPTQHYSNIVNPFSKLKSPKLSEFCPHVQCEINV